MPNRSETFLQSNSSVSAEHAIPVPRPIKFLFVAFACEPGRGSEPGGGWNFVDEASRRRPVWVLTHARFRKPIEAYLKTEHRHFPIYPIYVRLPGLGWLWNSHFGMNIYYYLWQFSAARAGRKAHKKVAFDIVQHVTYQRFWMHSAAASIGAPFIFGPVGGGDIWPKSMASEQTTADRIRVYVWSFIYYIMCFDPFLRKTLRGASAIIPSGPDSLIKLQQLGVKTTGVVSSLAPKPKLPEVGDLKSWDTFRFISIGRLPRWKGAHLALKAFAMAFGPNSAHPNLPVEYVIIGKGTELENLKRLAIELRIDSLVRFEGDLPYSECLKKLSESHAMIHMTLRDSAGLVFESLMLGVPVACTNIGCCSLLVDSTCGAIIHTEYGAEKTILEFSQSIIRWPLDQVLYDQLCNGAKLRADAMSREKRADKLEILYEEILSREKSKVRQND